jgi:hypothetical protein
VFPHRKGPLPFTFEREGAYFSRIQARAADIAHPLMKRRNPESAVDREASSISQRAGDVADSIDDLPIELGRKAVLQSYEGFLVSGLLFAGMGTIRHLDRSTEQFDLAFNVAMMIGGGPVAAVAAECSAAALEMSAGIFERDDGDRTSADECRKVAASYRSVASFHWMSAAVANIASKGRFEEAIYRAQFDAYAGGNFAGLMKAYLESAAFYQGTDCVERHAVYKLRAAWAAAVGKNLDDVMENFEAYEKVSGEMGAQGAVHVGQLRRTIEYYRCAFRLYSDGGITDPLPLVMRPEIGSTRCISVEELAGRIAAIYLFDDGASDFIRGRRRRFRALGIDDQVRIAEDAAKGILNGSAGRPFGPPLPFGASLAIEHSTIDNRVGLILNGIRSGNGNVNAGGSA